MLARRHFLLASLATVPAALIARASRAATAPVYAEETIAIDGSDAVAYFTDGAPVAGDPAITHDWNGATWRFSSEENRAAFAADPEAYAPQYGGYCAFAMSKGYIAPTVPEAWTIHEDKLYLNFSTEVRSLWLEDVPGHIASADGHWPGVLDT